MKSIAFATACSSVVCCLVCTALSAQKNLVYNPGFEVIEAGKTAGLDNPIDMAAGWSAADRGKALLYTTRGEYIYDPHGSSWPFKARTGKNVAGINVYGEDNDAVRREYIQGTLTRPLTVGHKYFFEFWVHYHCEGANNIGIVFLSEKIKDTSAGLFRFHPVSYQKKVTLYNNDKNTWTLVRDSFVARRPFQNFIIGNFFPDSLTKIEGNRFDHHFAYIDDILVMEASGQQSANALTPNEEEKKWDDNERASKGVQTTPAMADTVYFKFNSAEISPGSAAILDGIADRLALNPGAKIELKGFASSEGDTVYNKQLSKRRNQSVRKYLATKGVASSAISMSALGEENPLAPNDTEEGRGKNRRVEIVWGEK